MEQYFSGIAATLQTKILETELTIYEYEGEEPEIKEWFETINIAGVPLNQQELNNALYSGPFVTLAKEEFSNSRNSNIQKWKAYIRGLRTGRIFWNVLLIGLAKATLTII